jgi:hypothetical protein
MIIEMHQIQLFLHELDEETDDELIGLKHHQKVKLINVLIEIFQKAIQMVNVLMRLP